ncbi:hypothetical protein HY491_03960 [Candidatus Woesearchaeota archaeon]|nr:hypothetical protein [Candidatus Woesearchaeota archaeon]
MGQKSANGKLLKKILTAIHPETKAFLGFLLDHYSRTTTGYEKACADLFNLPYTAIVHRLPLFSHGSIRRYFHGDLEFLVENRDGKYVLRDGVCHILPVLRFATVYPSTKRLSFSQIIQENPGERDTGISHALEMLVYLDTHKDVMRADLARQVRNDSDMDPGHFHRWVKAGLITAEKRRFYVRGQRSGIRPDVYVFNLTPLGKEINEEFIQPLHRMDFAYFKEHDPDIRQGINSLYWYLSTLSPKYESLREEAFISAIREVAELRQLGSGDLIQCDERINHALQALDFLQQPLPTTALPDYLRRHLDGYVYALPQIVNLHTNAHNPKSK